MRSYTVRAGVLASDLDGAVVLLDANSGTYFQLNASGAHVWRALAGGDSVESVVTLLAGTYGIDPVLARTDVEALVAELEARRLIT